MTLQLVLIICAVTHIQAYALLKSPIKQWNTLIRPRPIHATFIPEYQERITGGEEVEPNSIPYQVALFLNKEDGQYFCGGSLISQNFVLTAAHCAIDTQSAEVILAAHNIREVEPWQVRMTSEKFIIHQGYNGSISNDIALVVLPSPAPLNEKISLVTLPTRKDTSNDFAGTMSTQSGWGRTSDWTSGITDKLQSVDSRVISIEECNEYYFGILSDEYLCTNTTGGKSICNGDSGGPLVTEDDVQIAITAFVIILGCEVGWPAGFTRVSSYLDWIEENSDVVIKD